MSAQMNERIFDGLKVIDCASFIAGPAAATVMSDFGADVIKIEPPGVGDPYRRRAVPVFLRQPQQEEPRARPAHRRGTQRALSPGRNR
jgi:crotonobetainyl-CoA:carnitine CoA-transferase CaiB-like acyl-CoA transferase